MAKVHAHHYPVWAEIDLKALEHNYHAIKRLAVQQLVTCPPQKQKNHPDILAVIKADAYGHGMKEVSSTLNRLGANLFAVSDVPEGILLRKNHITKPILLLESTLSSFAKDIVDYNLMPTVCTLELALALNVYAKRRKKRIDIHVSVDTGMGRLGVWHKDAKDFIRSLMKFSHLSLKGIYTHLPVADSDPYFTMQQLQQIYDLVTQLDQEANIVPYVHVANSMGLVGYKTHIFNLARPGLMLYGLYPSSGLRGQIKLKPVMTVKARVIFVKPVVKGRGVSYGHTYIARKDMVVATLSVGYNDGYLRCLSNKGVVLIKGVRCPVVGRVTMDQIMVDVSRIKTVKPGDEAVVFGRQGKEEISADALAKLAGTINYEIVCSLGNRVERIYKK